MKTLMTPAEVVTGPTTEPITLEEAKRHLFLPLDETNYDDDLTRNIQVAREQWEHDTDSAVLTQTLRMRASGFGWDFKLYKRPIQSITSVTYYDPAGVSQTLATTVYSADLQAGILRLKTNQTWPVYELSRWDAVTVTYVAGYTSIQLVPAIAKQAMLLMIGYYFAANRGDNDRPNDMKAYESLVTKYMRSSYP